MGEISKYFETIAIAGTHGKSTTTALMTYILSKIDPEFGLGILGALVPQLGQKNYWANPNITPDLQSIFTYILTGKSSEWDESLRKKYRFVIEADEFNRHFLLLDVDHAIILNAELDHSDIYPNEAVYLEAFVAFVHKVKHGIFAIHDEKGIEYIQRHCKKEFYSIKRQNIALGYIFGEHNEKNATLIHHLLQHLGIGNKDSIMHALHSFK
ncbi:MAG: Mur ligase family protein [bacterium]